MRLCRRRARQTKPAVLLHKLGPVRGAAQHHSDGDLPSAKSNAFFDAATTIVAGGGTGDVPWWEWGEHGVASGADAVALLDGVGCGLPGGAPEGEDDVWGATDPEAW